MIVVFRQIFCNIFNIISILIIIFSLLYCLYRFKFKMKRLNRKVYHVIVRIVYSTISVTILFYIDTIYILISKVLLNENLDWNDNIIAFYLLLFFFYALGNFTFPVLINVQILRIKKSLKTYGYYEGKDYAMARTENVQPKPVLIEAKIETCLETIKNESE